jgi:hypothetical protein
MTAGIADNVVTMHEVINTAAKNSPLNMIMSQVDSPPFPTMSP